jgi:peptidoglycan/LPS O-acetylase OafA/YrhL
LVALRRIKGLDGLRAIAVTLVVLNHNFYMRFHLATGGAGVRPFFVLSGFLIVSILHGRRDVIEKGAAHRRTELIHFYQNRLYRIWPIYFLALVLMIVTKLRLGTPFDLESWVANLLFCGNLLVAYVWFAWRQVGVLWSVAVEEQFYLWAGAALLFANRRWHLAICIAAMAIGVVAALATTMLVADAADATFSIDIGSLTNFGLIALGGATAIAVKPNRATTRLAGPALVLYLYWAITGFPSWMTGSLFFVPALLVALVLVGVTGNQDGLLVKALEIEPMRYIGRISYGIYLYHTLVTFEGIPGLGWFANHATVAAIAETGVAIALAAVSWHALEQPLLNLRDRRRQRANELRAVTTVTGAAPA